MDCFVRDVLDAGVMSSACIVTGTRVNLESLSGHPLLLKNLCFVHVWEALVGASPARSEFEEYIRNQPASAEADVGDTMINYILRHTALALVVLMPMMQHRVSEVRLSLPLHKAHLQTDAVALHGALANKLCKRFTGHAEIPTAVSLTRPCASMMHVIQLYAHLTDGDAVRFYAAEAERMRSDDSLWLVNPVTGSLLTRPEEEKFRSMLAMTGDRIEVTCADAMRRRLSHDAHMLRRSWGRTLVIDDTDDDADDACALVASALNDGPTDGESATLVRQRVCPLVRVSSVLPEFWRCYVTVAASNCAGAMSSSSVSTCAGRASYLLLWGATANMKSSGYTRIINVLTSATPRAFRHTIAPNVFVLLYAPAPWVLDLLGAMLRRHIAHPMCPTHSQRLADAVLLFEQALLLLAADKLLSSQEAQPWAAKPHDALHDDEWPISPVVIDTRARPASTVLALFLTLAHLSPGRRHVVVFCTTENKQYFVQAFSSCASLSDPRVTFTFDDTLAQLNDPKPFDVERHYNALMLSPSVWTALDRIGVRLALTVQDDGVLVRPGLDEDARFKDFAYVGAPWPDVPMYSSLKLDGNAQLVGNGGISLRDVRVMLRIVNDPRMQREARRLLFDNAQLVPEDVHFGWGVGTMSIPCCPHDVARAFSAEQVVPQNMNTLPFCLHKPWAYWPVDVTRIVMDAIVKNGHSIRLDAHGHSGER